VCIKPDVASRLSEYAKRNFPELRLNGKREVVVEGLLKALHLDSESQLWKHEGIRDYFGGDVADRYLSELYKPEGPANSTQLISSLDIDAVLRQWETNSQALFGRKLKVLPYQMDDFLQRGTELAKVDLFDLRRQGYQAMATILNTDSSTGEGEHWYCVFVDLGRAGTVKDPITLEYFNSSGNPPGSSKYKNIHLWIANTKVGLLRDHQLESEMVVAVPRRLQYSNTECGVWSMCYIHSRLSGNPSNYFDRNGISDEEMYKYRKHLFRFSPAGTTDVKVRNRRGM
jgi:hypothetical protein